MTYLVWRPDADETVDDARTYDASNISLAAVAAAEHDHAQRDGWEWSWPVTYRVQAGAGAPVYSVEVNRESMPSFWAERPRLA